MAKMFFKKRKKLLMKMTTIQSRHNIAIFQIDLRKAKTMIKATLILGKNNINENNCIEITTLIMK